MCIRDSFNTIAGLNENRLTHTVLGKYWLKLIRQIVLVQHLHGTTHPRIVEPTDLPEVLVGIDNHLSFVLCTLCFVIALVTRLLYREAVSPFFQLTLESTICLRRGSPKNQVQSSKLNISSPAASPLSSLRCFGAARCLSLIQ